MESLLIALHKVCKVEYGTESLVLGAMRLPGRKAAQSLENELREVLEEYGAAKIPAFADVSADDVAIAEEAICRAQEAETSMALAHHPLKQIPKEGSCIALYQLFRAVSEPWNKAGNSTAILVDRGFDKAPCGGDGCRFAYVGGSDCLSKLGNPIHADEAHLRIADLATSLERTTSPLASVEVYERGEGQDGLFSLCSLIMDAVCFTWNGQSSADAKGRLSEAVGRLGEGRVRLFDPYGRERRMLPKRKVRRVAVAPKV